DQRRRQRRIHLEDESHMGKFAIVGCGLVGRAWAITFARGGHEVALYDQVAGQPEAAIAFARSVLPELAKNDLLRGQAPDAILASLKPAGSLEAALDGAEHVQENTPEQVEVKRKVFAQLDKAAGPDTVLASSTSAILPSAFTEKVAGRHRCLVVHP